MSFQTRVLANFSKVSLFRYSGYLLTFVSTIVLSRYISPEEYGLIGLVTVFSGFFILFSDAGVSAYIVRSNEVNAEIIQFFSYLIGALFFLVMLLCSWPISIIYGDERIVLLSLIYSAIVGFSTVSVVPKAIFTKNLEFGKTARIALYRTIVEISLMILMAFNSFSYWSLVYPVLAGQLLEFGLLTKGRIWVDIPSRIQMQQEFEKMKVLVGSLGSFNFFNYWARNSDKFMVGKYYGEYDLGIYNRAYSILRIVSLMLTGAFNTVSLPSFQKLQNEGGVVKQEYIKTLRMMSLLVLPVSAVLILRPYDLSEFLWGRNWRDVGEFLPYIGVLLILQILSSTTGNMFIIFRGEKTFAWTGILNAGIAIVSIILGSLHSITGILVSYSVSFAVISYGVLIYFGFHRTFGFNLMEIAKALGDSWVVSILLLFCFIGNHPAWSLGVFIVYIGAKIVMDGPTMFRFVIRLFGQ